MPATFFVLGMTAERYPDLVREIARRGHELACHGYAHERVHEQTRPVRRDVERCAELLERLGGSVRSVPGAGLLDHPRHTVGLRGARRARLPLRLEPVRLAAGSRAGSGPCPRRHTGSSCRPGARSGSFRSRSGRSAAGRCRSAVARTGGRPARAPLLRRALRQVADENAYPVLYFHPYELDPRPLQRQLPESPTPRQRLLTAWKSVQRNPGRRRVADRIRAIAENSRSSARGGHGKVVERYGAGQRSLSREGVLV